MYDKRKENTTSVNTKSLLFSFPSCSTVAILCSIGVSLFTFYLAPELGNLVSLRTSCNRSLSSYIVYFRPTARCMQGSLAFLIFYKFCLIYLIRSNLCNPIENPKMIFDNHASGLMVNRSGRQKSGFPCSPSKETSIKLLHHVFLSHVF